MRPAALTLQTQDVGRTCLRTYLLDRQRDCALKRLWGPSGCSSTVINKIQHTTGLNIVTDTFHFQSFVFDFI